MTLTINTITADDAKKKTEMNTSLVRLNNFLRVISHNIVTTCGKGDYKFTFYEKGDIYNQACYASRKSIQMYIDAGYTVVFGKNGCAISLSWKGDGIVKTTINEESESDELIALLDVVDLSSPNAVSSTYKIPSETKYYERYEYYVDACIQMLKSGLIAYYKINEIPMTIDLFFKEKESVVKSKPKQKVIVTVSFNDIKTKVLLYINKMGMYVSLDGKYYFDSERKVFGVVPDLTRDLSYFILKTSEVISIEYIDGGKK